MKGSLRAFRLGLTASVLTLAAAVQAADAAPAATAPAAAAAPTEPLFALVNGTPITLRDYHAAYSNFVRNKFYHREGIAPERLEAARQDVADQMVDRLLFLEEVERRQIPADEKQVDEVIAGYERRYAASPMWQQNRDKMLPGLRQRLAEQSRLEALEKAVRQVPAPTDAELKAYYEVNQSLFTEPEKLRLHAILLKVDPSSPAATWEAAREEAGRIVKKLREGADFGELARIHSQDKSAEKDGDMGYLHLGMLPEPLQARIDKLALGEVGDPIDVLEGVGIFRLDERIPTKLRSLEEVKERARDLLVRDRQEQAWKDFIAGLRGKAKIEYLGRAPSATAVR